MKWNWARVLTHRLIMIDAPPLCRHRHLCTVLAAVKAGGRRGVDGRVNPKDAKSAQHNGKGNVPTDCSGEAKVKGGEEAATAPTSEKILCSSQF